MLKLNNTYCILLGSFFVGHLQATEIIRGNSYDPSAELMPQISFPVQGTMEEKIQQIEARLGLAQTLDRSKTHKDSSGRIVWEYSKVTVEDQGYRYESPGYSGSYGMKCFNQEGHPGYNPNKLMQCGGLMGANLADIDLSGGIDLRGASLTGSQLNCTNIQGGQLQGAMIQSADFSNLNRDCSSIDSSKINNKISAPTHFEGARLNKSRFTNANLSRSILTNVEAIGTGFVRAYMVGAHMSGDFSNANFSNADMRFALMDSMNVKGADFYEADLRGASLSNLVIDEHTNFNRAKFDINHPENLPFSICYAILVGMIPYEDGNPIELFIEDFYDSTSSSDSISITDSSKLDFDTPSCKWGRIGQQQIDQAADHVETLSETDRILDNVGGSESKQSKLWFTNLFGKGNKIRGVVRKE